MVSPALSIVIPVYNVAPYLRECLDSLLSQTVTDLEVIGVDNGSMDDSLQIMRAYVAQDSRVRLLSVSEKGAGRARNIGIDSARGEYIGFVDADDYVASDYFAKLLDVAKAEQADVAVTSAVCCFTTGIDERKWLSGLEKPTGAEDSIELRGSVALSFGISCNKIYRNDFLKKYGIRYGEWDCAGEDKPFVYDAAICASRIGYCSDAVYYYRQSPDSSSHTRKGRESFRIIDVYGFIKSRIALLVKDPFLSKKWLSVYRHDKFVTYLSFYATMKHSLRVSFLLRCLFSMQNLDRFKFLMMVVGHVLGAARYRIVNFSYARKS